MGVGGQSHAPAALPPGKTWYPLYRRLGGPQGLSVQVRKISPPPGFDPWTAQPVVSHYTDCAIYNTCTYMETVVKENFASWPDGLNATQMHQLRQNCM